MEKKQIKNSLDADIISVSYDIEKLEVSNNITEILKMHKLIKTKLDNINNDINNVKNKFNEINNIDTHEDIITDKEFNCSMEKINEFDITDCSLDEQIDKYKELLIMTNKCEQYLNSKKMEIINLD